MSQQGLRQASIRAVTGTDFTYEGDWHALWNMLSIPSGTFNERMIVYVNQKFSRSFVNVNSAMAYLASQYGADTFQSMGVFVPGINTNTEIQRFATGNKNGVPVLPVAFNGQSYGCRVPCWTLGDDLVNPVIGFANYVPDLIGVGEIGGINATLRQSIEWPPNSGTYYSATYGGASSIALVANTAQQFEADPIAGLTLTKNSLYQVRNSFDFGSNGSFSIIQNQRLVGGAGDGAALGNSTSFVDYSTGGTLTAVAGQQQAPGHFYVRGSNQSSGYNVLILGDSIADGIGDQRNAPGVGGGDYWGASSLSPYINKGNWGWVEEGLGIRHGVFSLAQPGKHIFNYATQAYNAKQWAAAQKVGITHVIIQVKLNDLSDGTTDSQIVIYCQQVIALCRSLFPGALIGDCTITPRTTSTDGWLTIENQAFAGLSGAGAPAAYSADINTDGRLRLNQKIRNGDTGADFILDPAALVEYGPDPRKWAIRQPVNVNDTGAPTLDGTHPEFHTHKLLARALANYTLLRPKYTNGTVIPNPGRVAFSNGFSQGFY